MGQSTKILKRAFITLKVYVSICAAEEIDDRTDLKFHPLKLNSLTMGGR